MAQEHNAETPAEPAEDKSSSEGGDKRDSRPPRGRGDGKRGPKGKDRGKPRHDRRGGRESSPLKAGLFASVAEKQMPCRVDGCTNTWGWSGPDQMRNFGQEAPRRMCDEHLAEFNELEDREIACRNPGCTNTWTWKRGTQLHQLQKTSKLKPPARLCASCFESEKSLADTEVACRVGGCQRKWKWTREAQQKHRAWLRRLQAKILAEEGAERGEADAGGKTETASEEAPRAAEAPPSEPSSPAESTEARAGEATEAEPSPTGQATEAEPSPTEEATPAEANQAEAQAPEGKKKKRRKKRRKKRKVPEGPPERMCDTCAARFATLAPIEQPCKVHGCSRTWTWSKDHQLKAWAALGTEDMSATGAAPRRMCNNCRDFCRDGSDKRVECGRPGCSKTWTWKTGAQLQARLAGKTQDPIRLCDACAKGEFLLAGAARAGLPPGAEVMPCVVPACNGTWTFIPGMTLASAQEGELPPDRMCDKCRGERELPARGGAPTADPEPEEKPVEENSGGNSVEENSGGNSVEENSGGNSVEENSEGSPVDQAPEGDSAAAGRPPADVSPDPVSSETEAPSEPGAEVSADAEVESPAGD